MVNVSCSDNPGVEILLDQNYYGDQQGCIFSYSYAAPDSGSITLTFTAVNPADTWHHYAFTNEKQSDIYVDPTPAPGAELSIYDQFSWKVNGSAVDLVCRLKVAADPAMSNLITDVGGLTSNTFDAGLDPEGQYYWQIEVYQQNVLVHASPVWPVTTLPVPPDAVKLLEWKFDESDGIVASQTGQVTGANGILSGFDNPVLSRVQGIANGGIYLNGKDEYIDISSAHSYMPTSDGEDFAISGYFCTFDDYGPLFSMRNSGNENPIIDIALGADGVQEYPGKVCVLVRDDSGSMSSMYADIYVNDGLWHNFVVSRIGSEWTLYIDGTARAGINNAAAGNVNLDMLAIGTSLRWIADNWQPDYNKYRDFQGILDEYTVWSGQLQPLQFNSLVKSIPTQADCNSDLYIDINDMESFSSSWLDDTEVPILSDEVIEDMDSYTANTNSYTDYWQYTPETGFGILNLSIISDADDQYGNVMQVNYDFNGAIHAYAHVQLKNRGVNLAYYDLLNVRFKKLPGCDIAKFIFDFYDARDKEFPVNSDLYKKGRVTIDISDIAADQWVTVSGLISSDSYGFKDCTDLYQVQMSLENGGADTGTILIDSISLVDIASDCIPAVHPQIPDFNNDCIVDLLDFAFLADQWLK